MCQHLLKGQSILENKLACKTSLYCLRSINFSQIFTNARILSMLIMQTSKKNTISQIKFKENKIQLLLQKMQQHVTDKIIGLKPL